MRRKIVYGLILFSQTFMVIAQGNTLFSIKPSETTLYLSSNASASVLYEITNNSSEKTLPSITLGYKSSGKNLTIGSNTCNVELLPNTSCTFRALISGANQPETFTINPRVCGFNGFVCSVSSMPVTVNVTRVNLPTRAYEEVDTVVGDKVLIGININDTSDIISASLGSIQNINSVVSSPDGSKLYAIYDNNHIAFFDVQSSDLRLIQTYNLEFLSAMPGFYTDVLPAFQMAITPDGTSLFVVGPHAPSLTSMFVVPLTLYRFDLTTDPATIHVIGQPHNLLQVEAGLVVSPDGKTLYISSSPNVVVAMPVNANSISSNDIISPGSMPIDDHLGIAIDSAGSKLFVANNEAGSVSIFKITDGVTTFDRTILEGPYSGASGLAVSPDGETLYVAETNISKVLAVALSTPVSVFSWNTISQPFGLGLSPNGSLLYVTQIDTSLNKTTVIDTTNYLATLTEIDIFGISNTIGKFMGP